jgi:hypothetical protein
MKPLLLTVILISATSGVSPDRVQAVVDRISASGPIG